MGLISIIVPVTARLNRLVLQCKQLEKLAADTREHDFEFIFVDDGSNLESNARIEELSVSDKRFRLVLLTRDFGETAAFLAGAACASGDCTGFFSGRNLDPSKIFGELIGQWKSGAKIVLGKWQHPGSHSRKARGIAISDPLLRRRLFPHRIYFQEISSLVIDKEVNYILTQISDPFSDLVEILAWTGIDPVLVEYEWQETEVGTRHMVFHLQSIALNYSEGIYSPRTFRRSLLVGFALGALGALISAGLIVANLYARVMIAEGWMFVGVISFMIGVQLILMGVFGELVYRSLEKIRSRPLFIVDTVINPPVSSPVQSREKIEKMILSLWNVHKRNVAYVPSQSAGAPGESAQE